ncbi:MAG TPA: GAF domain-containing protein [Verrucomicrobiae bacterium]|nr:GAF domain-containing protein [Verrucomicrobiae bacterium]
MKTSLPLNEAGRLEALRRYNVLDTPPEAVFDDLALLAAQICGTPMAVISLVDEARQWFKARIGVEVAETPREVAFCAHTVLQPDQIMEVPDAEQDARFINSPLMTEDPHIRFYAGAPLVDPRGHVLGALCVMDRQPRKMTKEQLAALQTLSRHVVAQLELHRLAVELAKKNVELERSEEQLRENIEQLARSEKDANRLLDQDERSRLALLSVVEDVQRAQADLRKNAAFINDVINSLTAHVVVLDADGKIIEANQPWVKFATANNAGTLASGYLGENYLTICANSIRLTNDADALAAMDGIRAVLAGSKPGFILEYPCHSPAERRWFQMRVTPLTGPQPGVVVTHENITERKLAEMNVLKLNRIYAVLSDINQTIVRKPDSQAMFDAACDIAVKKGGFRMAWIGLLDPKLRVVKPVAQAGKFDDYLEKIDIVIQESSYRDGPTAIAIKTRNHSTCNDIERDQRTACWRTEALRLGYRSSASFPLIVRGQVIGAYNLYAGESRFFDDDELRLLDGLATDISFAVEISQQDSERAKLEEQFRQSQKMEAFGQLAGGVAHDFNNILAVIQMQAGMLQTEPDVPPTQMHFAAEIEKAAERAANLTRQLLLFSRRQTLQLRDLDLNDVVVNITKMLYRILGEDIKMQIIYAPQPLFVHADAGMMDQILMNLTVNSRDAMPKGGQLIIETSAVELDEPAASQTDHARPGSFACLSVSDTGGGIPAEILPHIFEPFFTTKDVGKGTGLGLATVFGIVQQHQGWINVLSEPGRGATFRIYFPRLAKAVEKKSTLRATARMRGGSETILLVEDDASLRKSVRTTLSRLGYKVVEAMTGVEALEVWKLHHEEISLLLTDMVMPDGMNGIELAEKLLRKNPGLKVIYTSGYSADVDGKDFPLDEGVNFLAKPYEAHKLAKTVRSRLDAD